MKFPTCIFIIFFPLATGALFAQSNGEKVPTLNPAQLAWQDAELGVIFHYDLHVFDNKRYVQSENRITPVADYNIFNPRRLDTDQWIKAAGDMGATFALLTATHETGFALFQSDVNPYCLKAVKWQQGKGDLVRDFIASCKKYGINHVVIMENISRGEKIRNYIIEGKTGGQWIKLCEGSCVGHKRIQRFNSVTVSDIRLIINKATAVPFINKLAVY
ncbi:MAG: alpha-L-fucosidase [Calditrichaeota bacterium]|nr:alpha-L-fucosidase [Calditrichota bacterium]